ncbi:hypothetical protein CTI12_AA363160 [Artemisia annua]|uniref:Uncharacterized protein n=1 Tax=Artemisia annua TaxID=35608 RepID=A0A2U1MME8_ARTAN|nr:hypothetical protein CTI12_AA363160 [Artemisia annua]
MEISVLWLMYWALSLSSQLVSLMADGSPSGGPCLSFANRVWVEQTMTLKPSFKQVLDTVYKTKVCHSLSDFSYIQQILEMIQVGLEKGMGQG